MTRAKDISKIVSDANFGGTLDVAGVLTGASLDISGDIDVDGTTNLDVVDIDGAVDMASTLAVGNTITSAVNGTMSNLILDNDADTPYMAFQESGTTNLFIGESSIIGGGGTGFYDFYGISGIGQRFFTNATERMRIHNNGVVSASAGVALGVGTANTASNVLDDYEEGTWTATITPDVSGSITIGNGLMRYTKVGRLVTVSGLIVCAGKSSPVGAPVIGGLPFTVNNNTDGVYSGLSTGSIHIQALAGDIGVPQINVPNNSTVITIDGFNGTGNTAISGNFGAATQIRICATYTV